MRLLFSSIHCYLDPSSGAALYTRELLELLAGRGTGFGPGASLRSAPATQASFPIMGYNESRWSSARSLGGRLRFLGAERTALSLRQGLDQAVVAQRQDVLVQDPGNHRQLGQPDGRSNDPAFEPANQGLDHVSPLCGEQTHL